MTPGKPTSTERDDDAMPADLRAVLEDAGCVIPRDTDIWELIGRWRNAPTATASAPVGSGQGDAVAPMTPGVSYTDEQEQAAKNLMAWHRLEWEAIDRSIRRIILRGMFPDARAVLDAVGPVSPDERGWRAVANDFQRAMFEREAVIDQMKQALSFLQSCCRSGEHTGADHPIVLGAIGAANTRQPSPVDDRENP